MATNKPTGGGMPATAVLVGEDVMKTGWPMCIAVVAGAYALPLGMVLAAPLAPESVTPLLIEAAIK